MGDIELVSYTYGANNGPLLTMTYGSGDWVEYSYDNLGRVTVEQHLNESDNVTATYQYFYNSEGVLAKKLDVGTGKAVNYEYDSLGRMIRSWETYGNTIEQKTEHLYDTSNRLIEQSWQLGEDIYSESYVYNSDGTLYMVDSDDFYQYGFGYDSLKRLSYRQNWLYRQTYSYRDIDADTTGQITDISYTSRGGGTEFDAFTLSYEYDTLGNIKKITDSDDNVTEYTYDVQGQMTKEIVNDVITEYVYDTYGNIRQVKDSNGNVLHTYTYGDANWLDKLTAYDGTAIVYDEVGNPTLYTNGKNQWGMQWNNGRQLIRAACADYTATYTYDQDGIRDSKTVGTTTYNYITQNGKVVRQTWGSNVMDFIYDNTGRPYCCVYSGTKYYYICNLQGDVIRIVDTSGATVAEYSYDAWGNVLSVTGSMKTSLGADNPIRYRGYYYDAETGFYYLQSRYYDPSIGRFINNDGLASTGQGFLGYNMFAYCLNNPANGSDPCGTCFHRLDFWNDCANCGGQSIVDKTIKAFNIVVDFHQQQNAHHQIIERLQFEYISNSVKSGIDNYSTIIQADMSEQHKKDMTVRNIARCYAEDPKLAVDHLSTAVSICAVYTAYLNLAGLTIPSAVRNTIDGLGIAGGLWGLYRIGEFIYENTPS